MERKSALMIPFALVLSSCASLGRGYMSILLDSEPNDIPYEKIVDFSIPRYDGFYFADGYSNGGTFNCSWSKNCGEICDGELRMSVKKEGNRYFGAEFRSPKWFGYGYYCAMMKAAPCSGVISSFFLYTRMPVWDEIDIEILGKDMRAVQFNYYVNGNGNHGYLYKLPYDASKEYHEYGFNWLKDSITWYIDGKPVYKAYDTILPSHKQNLMANVWNCIGFPGWSGEMDDSSLPATASYRYFGYSPAE